MWQGGLQFGRASTVACQSRGAHPLLLDFSLSRARRRQNPALCPAVAVRALRVCERGHSGGPCPPRGAPPRTPFPPRTLFPPRAAPRGPRRHPDAAGTEGWELSPAAQLCAAGGGEIVRGSAGTADAGRGSPRGASPAEPGLAQPPHCPSREVKLTGLKANPTEKGSYLRCTFGLAICEVLGARLRGRCVRLAASFHSRSPASPAHFSHQIGH